jgi:hypothetical protein
MIKKKLKYFYRIIIYNFFFLIYKKPKLLPKNSKFFCKVFDIKIDNKKYYLFKILNGRIYTNTIDDTAYIESQYLIPGPSFQYRDSVNSNIDNNVCLRIGTPKFLKKLKGTVLSLLTGGAGNHNYGHWLWDVLPRIYLFNKFFSLKKVDFFLTPSLRFSFQKDSLKLLGIPKKKIVDGNNYRHLQAEEIFATSHPSFHHPEKISKFSIEFLRKSFLTKKILSKKIDFKMIYLDRGDGALLNNKNIINFKNHRIIVNEDEVKKYLISIGFKIIKPQDLSFKDQVNIFNNVKCVVSLQGAGLANAVFCKPGTKIVEIKSVNGGNEFLRVSKFCKLNHYQISLKTIFKSDGPQNGLMNCPVNKVEYALKYLKII